MFEQEQQQNIAEIIKIVLEKLFENAMVNTELLAMFIDKQMFDAYLMQKNILKAREEINEENFADLWERIKQDIPKEIVLPEQKQKAPEVSLPKVSRKRYLSVQKDE